MPHKIRCFSTWLVEMGPLILLGGSFLSLAIPSSHTCTVGAMLTTQEGSSADVRIFFPVQPFPLQDSAGWHLAVWTISSISQLTFSARVPPSCGSGLGVLSRQQFGTIVGFTTFVSQGSLSFVAIVQCLEGFCFTYLILFLIVSMGMLVKSLLLLLPYRRILLFFFFNAFGFIFVLFSFFFLCFFSVTQYVWPFSFLSLSLFFVHHWSF